MPRRAKKSKNFSPTAERVCNTPLLSSFSNPLKKTMEVIMEMTKAPVTRTTILLKTKSTWKIVVAA